MEKSKKNFRNKKLTLLFLLLSLIIFNSNFGVISAEVDIDELRSKIEEKNKAVAELNKEIEKSTKELQIVSQEANTLQGTVKSLDLSRQKLSKDVELTSGKIESTNLNLSKLEIEIKDSKEKIKENSVVLSEALRLMKEEGDKSMLEVLLKYDDFSSFWTGLENLERFQVSVGQSLESLKSAKEVLEVKHEEDQRRRGELVSLKEDLSSQKKTVEVNKQQKEVLLTATKNRESEYQKILARNLAIKAELEKELYEFESQLQIAIDPNKLPDPRRGILSWPVDNIRITQMFGRTADSGRLYASGTHNGIDFGVPSGTRIKSVLDGVISHAGNTDEVRGCYSFGRWILVKHNNGLSTLYSHLSQTAVSVGQQVKVGDTIAYSGGVPGTYGAGYSTGAHLHFGLYATEGLRPQKYQSQTPCNGAYMPLADQKAYMDPMAFLPLI